MAYKKVETKKDIQELIDSSAITMIGLCEGKNGDLEFK